MDDEWVEKQWKGVDLGDKRLEKRAIKIGKACLRNPESSLPKKFGDWSEIKGAYRFFDSPNVTHTGLQKVHNKNVIEIATNSKKMVLFIQDGSELIYNTHLFTHGLGHTSDAFGQGIMFHTCLAVEWTENTAPVTLGIAKQTAWIRQERSKKSTKTEQKDKESKVWLDMLHAVGQPPPESHWMAVGDRGNDIYEYILGATKAGWNYTLRAKHNRMILVEGEKKRLHNWIRSLDPGAEYELNLRARGNKFSRKAVLNVSWGEVTILPPQGKEGQGIPVTYLRAHDPDDKDLEWILITSLPINSAEEALRIIRIYEQRWIIEEYHKCLKTGCRIEEAQLKSGTRLLALLGVLGVIATQLLKLRDFSRQQPDIPAEDVASKEVIGIIKHRYKLKGTLSVKELWRRIAMFGGFLGRKSDGNPGWQTIWYGWLRIQDMLAGIEFSRSCG